MSTDPMTRIPPLESGDRLTRLEFERRYKAMPQINKAELVEGVVYVASPARVAEHSRPHRKIITWLAAYSAATPGLDFADHATVRLDADNQLQPGALLRLETQAGGSSRISQDHYLEGAPELVAEIASSSAAYDLGSKLNAYRRNGVQEYVVWQVYENRLDWFYLEEGRYVLRGPDAEGLIRSSVFPGLWLAVDALQEGDLAQVLAVLQQGLQSPEHQAFVESLNRQESQAPGGTKP